MDYSTFLKKAENRIGKQFPDVIQEIKNLIRKGSTGGEITVLVGHFVKELKMNNPNAFKCLEMEINEFLISCKKAGLVIK